MLEEFEDRHGLKLAQVVGVTRKMRDTVRLGLTTEKGLRRIRICSSHL